MIEILKIALVGFMFSALTQQERSCLSWYGRLIKRLPWWLCKPLGGCYMCVAGQLMFWYFILTRPFDLFELAFAVSAGIFVSMIYNKIYCYLWQPTT